MENESWKPVSGYEGRYEVSSHGRVKTLARSFRAGRNLCVTRFTREKIMAIMNHRAGYQCVWFRCFGLHKKFFVHRLVAEAFIPNPDKEPIVNHIDGDKKNNRISNLEWISESENTQYYYDCRRVTDSSF